MLRQMILLNLGWGIHAPDGWVNIDRSPNLLLDRLRFAKPILHKAGVLSDAHMVSWPRNIDKSVRNADTSEGSMASGSPRGERTSCPLPRARPGPRCPSNPRRGARSLEERRAVGTRLSERIPIID